MSVQSSDTVPGAGHAGPRVGIVITAAAVIVALTELLGTRLGSQPADPVRITVLFALLVGAISLHALRVKTLVDRDIEEIREHFERDFTAAKDTFIANVSHGLRTPLTGVVGFAHVLDAMEGDPDRREAVRVIISESAELSRMVDDLVTAAQLDADALTTSLRPVRVIDEVEKVLDFMDLVGAEVGLDMQDVDVMVDPSHFSQVLRNLVTNAHRHGKPTITVRGVVANGKYVCHVVDQGPGVSSSDQQRLFSRFSSSVFGSQFTGSVGLGLAVVAELTARMGCEISYRRIRGETQFVLSIPLAETQSCDMARVVRAPGRRHDHQDAPRLRAVGA